jgi:hypothetical protein
VNLGLHHGQFAAELVKRSGRLVWCSASDAGRHGNAGLAK